MNISCRDSPSFDFAPLGSAQTGKRLLELSFDIPPLAGEVRSKPLSLSLKGYRVKNYFELLLIYLFVLSFLARGT